MSSRREKAGIVVFIIGIMLLLTGLALGIALTTGAFAQEMRYGYSYAGILTGKQVTLPKEMPEDISEGETGRGLIEAALVNGSAVVAFKYDNRTRIVALSSGENKTLEVFGIWRISFAPLNYTGSPRITLKYTLFVETYPPYLYIVDAAVAVLGAALAASGMPQIVRRLSRRY